MSADTEIVREFLIESYENLDQLDRDFVALEKDPTERARIAGIFRAIHTLKGTACFLNFPKLAALTHAGENVLSRLRDGDLQLTPEITSALLSMVDAVREMLRRIEESNVEGDNGFASVIGDLSACLREEDPPPQEAPSRLGQILVEAGELGSVELMAALDQQKRDPRMLGEILVSRGSVRPKAVVEALKVQAEGHAPVAETNIRVDIGLLDKLMNLVGELVLARNQIVQLGAARRDAALVNASQRLNLVATELQEGVMRTRMQPIASVWNKLPRVVRDLSLACGKQVEIELEGKETELDRTVLEAIKDPLTHIVRNTIDHGIETPEVRLSKGKSPIGRLHLRAFHEGGQVNIQISDDGAGVNLEKVKAKALQRGIVSAERVHQMTDAEIAQLVFLPGFSTAEQVTNVSGRGVGMDVVKTNIERTGGTVDLVSRPDQGTTLKIKIPLTLAIIPALIVALGSDRYAIPQASLLELVRIDAGEVARRIESIQGTPVLRLRDKLLPLVDLRKVLGEPPVARTDDVNVIILQADERSFGLIVDGVRDTEEIVVKPLGRELKRLAAYAGATILGDGSVALILDVAGLARRAEVVTEVRESTATVAEDARTDSHVRAGEALLLVQRGAHDRIALPLALVSRLEEFPAGNVEEIDCRRVMQYRGDILPLVSLDGVLGSGQGASDVAAGKEKVQVVVLSNGNGSVGLEIDRILDIVYDRVVVKKAGVRPGVSGTAVIQGRVTQMLDVSAAMSTLGMAAAV